MGKIISTDGTITETTEPRPVNATNVAGALVAGMAEQMYLLMPAALSADGKYFALESESGTAGEALDFGELAYFDVTTSEWLLADWNADTTTYPLMGFCILAAAEDAATRIMFKGKIRADSLFPTLTVGQPVFAGVAGAIQDLTAMLAVPPGSADCIRCVGHAKTANEVVVNVENFWGEIATV